MRVRPIYGSGGQYVKLEPTDSSHRIGPQPASDGWVCCRAALYPAESIEKSIGYPIVAEASKLHPLPMNRRSEIVHHAKRDSAGGEETGAGRCGRRSKSAARIQKLSSRRSVMPVVRRSSALTEADDLLRNLISTLRA